MLSNKSKQLGVARMTGTIAASLDEIRKIELIEQHPEKCFQQSEGSETAELLEFYIELADSEGISLKELAEELSHLAKKAADIKRLLTALEQSSNFTKQIESLTAIHDKLSEIVEAYWNYLHPKAVECLKEVQEEIEKSKGKVSWIGITGKILVTLISVAKGKNLLAAYRSSAMRLANAISEAVEQDIEDAIDLEDARAAKEEAKREGTVSWEDVKARLNL